MAFERILFVPRTDSLDQSGARALLALADPGTVVEVFEPVFSSDLQDYSAVDGESFEKARDALVEKRMARLGSLVEQLQERGLEASITAAWDHPVHEAIIRRVLATGADLVITEPIEGRAGALSNGDWRLASRCPVPLLLVRSERAGDYEHIVAAVDPFHTHAKPAELDPAIIARAVELQKLTEGELAVVNCFAPLTQIAPGPFVERLPLDDAEESLEAYRRDALLDLMKDVGVDANSARLLKGRPSKAIQRLVESGEVDLLVMGAMSRGRIAAFVLGSTAEHLLYHTQVDVLLVKPPGFETTVSEEMPEDLLIRPLYFPF